MENRDNKNWTNFFLGLVVAILPFLYLPTSWKTFTFVVAGLLVALFSLARASQASQTDDQSSKKAQ